VTSSSNFCFEPAAVDAQSRKSAKARSLGPFCGQALLPAPAAVPKSPGSQWQGRHLNPTEQINMYSAARASSRVSGHEYSAGQVMSGGPLSVSRNGPSGTGVAELLVDTDVCIDHLRGVKRLPRASRLGYSVITRAELLAGATSEDEANVRRLLAGMDELAVDRRVAEKAGLLRRQLPGLPNARRPYRGNCAGSLAQAPHEEQPRLQTGSGPTTAVTMGARRAVAFAAENRLPTSCLSRRRWWSPGRVPKALQAVTK
jgi:hypothetical protein